MEKEKATFNLSEDILIRLEDDWLKLRRKNRSITKTLIVEKAIESFLDLIKSSEPEINWTRATYFVDPELHDKMKAVAYWERITIKEVVNEAFIGYLKDKTVDPIPAGGNHVEE